MLLLCVCVRARVCVCVCVRVSVSTFDLYNLYLSGLEGLGFGSHGLGFGSVEGLGGPCSFEFRDWVKVFVWGNTVWGLGCRALGLGLRVRDLGLLSRC